MKDLEEYSSYNVDENEDRPRLSKKKTTKPELTPALLQDPILKDWLRFDPTSKFIAICRICKCKIRTISKSYLIKHGNSAKHLKNSQTKAEVMDVVVSDDIVEMSIIKSGLGSLDDSDSKRISVPSKNGKKRYRQKFSKHWLKIPEMRDWLRPHPKDKFLVMCIICDTTMRNFDKVSLKRHGTTRKHKKFFNMKKEKGAIPPPISIASIKRDDSDDDYDPGIDDTHYSGDSDADGNAQTHSTSFVVENMKCQYSDSVEGDPLGRRESKPSKKTLMNPLKSHEKVSHAELVLSQYIDDNGIGHKQADEFVDVIKKMFPLDTDIQQLSFDRIKVSYLLHDRIAWDDEGMVSNFCRENVFSLMIDECSTAYGSYVLPIMARFFNDETCKITEGPLGVISVEEATSERLYRAIMNVLDENDIPPDNMIGFASDNFGLDKGVQAYLKRDSPYLFVLGCVSHSFFLSCSKACSNLPSWMEDLVKDICGYFSHVSSKKHDFHSIQEAVQNRLYKTLTLSESSFLSRSLVVAELVKNWDELQIYFQVESELEDDEATHIYQAMLNPGAKHILLFLNYINQKIDKMDQEFQSEYFKLHSLFTTISEEYKALLKLFISDQVINSVCLGSIDPTDRGLFKKIEHVNLGGRCKVHLVKESLGENERKFRNDCLAFLVDLCVEIKNKFSFQQNSVLSLLRILDPVEALSPKRSLDAIIELAAHFPNLTREEDLDCLQDQWIELPGAEGLSKSIGKASIFWNELGKLESNAKFLNFKLLSKFMCSLLALPHSSSFVEQVFSQVNYVM